MEKTNRAKKLSYLLAGLMIFSLSCAAIPTKPISSSDFPDLKGKWPGYRYGVSYTHPTELEIFNETLTGQITFYDTTYGTAIYPITGKIENGQLVIRSGGNWAKLKLRKGEGDAQMKLVGDYQWFKWGGTLDLKKVK